MRSSGPERTSWVWPAPVISEIDDPSVRVVLLGGDLDAAIVALVGALTPPQAASVDSLHLTRQGWVDAETAAPVLQRSSRTEAEGAIRRLTDAHLDPGGLVSVITPVQGIPPHHPRAFRLSDTVCGRLASHRTPERREALILG